MSKRAERVLSAQSCQERPRRKLGILMLDTRFPRPPGDIGHPQTFDELGTDVIYRIITGASARQAVETGDPSLLQPFIEAGLALVGQGAERIGTSCGFLARFQQELQSALPVPVLSSALLACAALDAPGILTFSAASLTEQVLAAAGVPDGTPVEGVTPGCEFHRRIINDDARMDLAEAERDVVDAALRLVTRHPHLKTIVLECTNMPVYRASIEAATGRATIDLARMLAADTI